MRATAVILLGLLAAAGTPRRAVFTWDGGGDGISWEDPFNWNFDSGFPDDAGDDARIDNAAAQASGTINLGAGKEIRHLQMAPGVTLNVGANTLSVRGNVSVENVGNGVARIIGGGKLLILGQSVTNFQAPDPANDTLEISNLEFNDGGNGNDIVIQNNVTVRVMSSFAYTDAPLFDVRTGARFAAPGITVPAGDELRFNAATLEISGALVVNGVFTHTTASTVEFSNYVTAASSIGAGANPTTLPNVVVGRTGADTTTLSPTVNLTVQGNWTVNAAATFSGGTGTVTFPNANAVSGTGAQNFNNLTINNVTTIGGGTKVTATGTLLVVGTLTASGATADTITIDNGNFDVNGTFNEGISRVVFKGASPTMPDLAERFYDIEIAATTSAVALANYTVVRNWIATTANFSAGAFTVTFDGPTAGYAGAAATTFNAVVVDGSAANEVWTLDAGDDVTVSTLTVNADGRLAMAGSGTLRLGVSATINGSFTATGTTPTIVDTGGDFAFTVAGGAGVTLDVDALNFTNPDNNGLRVTSLPGTLFDVDGVAFTNDDGAATGTYLNIAFAISGGPFAFTGCSFDANCEFNVATAAGSANLSVQMLAFGGAKGDESFENDKAAGVISPGSIEWIDFRWTNATADGLWSTPGNWTPAGPPTAGAKVLIPDKTTTNGAGPTLNITTSVGSVTLQARGELLTDNGTRTLTIDNGLTAQTGVAAATVTVGANDLITVGTTLDNDGTVTINGAGAMTIGGDLDNSGTFTQTAGTLAVSGNVTNSGALDPTTLTISGSYANSGTLAAGAVIFNGASGTIASGGVSFTTLTINAGSSYAATDALAVTGTFTLPGVLTVQQSLTFGATFVEAGGEVGFAGTAAQTVPAETYNRVTIANTTAVVTAGGAINVAGDMKINPGATFAGSSQTITLTGSAEWNNNGGFTGGTSTVVFAGSNRVTGSSVTTFANLRIDDGATLRLVGIGTVRIAGTWTNKVTEGTDGFLEGSSTVEFTGAPSTIAGSAITRFNNLTIAGTLQLNTPATSEIQLRNVWTNNGSFSSGGTTVRFIKAAANPEFFLDTFEAPADATDPPGWTVHDLGGNGDDLFRTLDAGSPDPAGTRVVNTQDDGTLDVGDPNLATGFERGISTAGEIEVNLEYARMTSGLDAGEFFRAQWSADAGANWSTLEQLGGTNGWTTQTFALPASAEANPDFRVRFVSTSNADNDFARVDRVRLFNFVGASAGAIAGTSPTTFATLIVDAASGATLTIDGSDDVTVTNLLTLSSGARLDLNGTAFLRLSTGMDVAGGTFVVSGSKPTLTDTGGDFSFIVQGGGTIDIDGLIFQNPNNGGLTIASTAAATCDVDSVDFKNDDGAQTGVYLRNLRTTGTYTFSLCTFDNNCEFNVSCSSALAVSAITMTGFGGVRGGEGFEDEDDATAGQQTGPNGAGRIDWPEKIWDGSTSSDWNNNNNWTAPGLPGVTDRARIPTEDPGNPGFPPANWPEYRATAANSTIAALAVEQAAIMTSQGGASRKLTISGNLTIDADGGAGAPGSLTWRSDTNAGEAGFKVAGTLNNNGTFTITQADPLKFEVNGNFNNAGTFQNDTSGGGFANLSDTEGGLLVAGNLVNSGTFIPVSNADGNTAQLIRVTGNWTNNPGGTWQTGQARVILNGANGTITSNGQAFNKLEIPAGSTYTALDGLTVNTQVRVDGRLIVKTTLSFGVGATFVTGTGTIEFAGAAAQTIPVPPVNPYFNLDISNTSASGATLGGDMTVNNNLTIAAGGKLAGSTRTLTIGQDWTNDGTFQSDTSTVVFQTVPSTIRGSAVTEFNHLTIASSTLAVASPPNQIDVKGTWTNNSSFIAGGSTMRFTGTTSQIAGSNVTTFNNATIASGATLSVGAVQIVNVNSTWRTDGAFSSGTSIVRFTGAGGAIAGAAQSAFNVVQVQSGGTLTLDGADDVRVNGTTLPGAPDNVGLLVRSGGTLSLTGSSILRLGQGLSVGTSAVGGGTLSASGSTPAITDTGAKYSFNVYGGTLNITALNLQNPNAGGITVQNSSNFNVTINGAAFSGGNATTGVYVNLLYAGATAIPSGQFAFSNCSFDANCLFNVHTQADAADSAVNMLGFSGAKGDPEFEDDRGAGKVTPADPGGQGSIRWAVFRWTNGAANDQTWATPGNWNPSGPPPSTARVIIPDKTTTVDPGTLLPGGPILNLTTTVGSILVESNGEILSDNGTRVLTVTGGVTVQNIAAAGAIDLSANDRLSVGGTLDNDGTFTHAGNALKVTGTLDNSGTFTNGGTGAIVNGSVVNSGSMTLGSMRVEGSFTNTGTLAAGAGTVTFGKTTGSGTGTIASGGQSFNGVKIEPNYTYTATDGFTTSGLLDVNGTLKVNATLTINGTFDGTAGTVEYSGTGAQTMVAAPGGYFNLSASNAAGVTAVTLTVNNDLRIVSGTLNGSAATLTVARDFINDGTFNRGTSTVVFTGVPSSVAGTATTTFQNVTISGTLQIAGTGTARFAAIWTNNGTFTSGTSTVVATGATPSVAGTASTTFNHLTIDAGATLTISTSPLRVKGTLTNNGSGIAAGTHTVEFTGTASAVAGGALTFDTLALGASATLTLDGADDVRANQAVTIDAGETLRLEGTSTLRLAVGITVSGTLVAVAGSTQTITDTGSKFAFTVAGGTLDLDDLNFTNSNVDGLRVDSSANKSIGIDGVSFTGGSSTAGIYINLRYAAPNALTAGDFVFSGCSFDANCFYNVRTFDDAAAAAIDMTGFGGAKGDAFYEADNATTPAFGAAGDERNTVADPELQGSIRWSVYTWTNAVDNNRNWSTPGNWSPVGPPPANARVVIPDKTTTIDPTLGPGGPRLNLNTTVGSILVQANGEILSDNLTRVLTTTGGVTVQGTATPGAIDLSANDRLSVGGSLDNDGTFTHAGNALKVTGTLDNSGTFTNGGTGAVVNGSVVNSGSMTLGSMRVEGSFTNTGTLAAGAGTVTFGKTTGSGSGTIGSAGQAFNAVVVEANYTYTATDGFAANGNLDVNGTLKVNTTLAINGTFDGTAGTVEYGGSAAQTMVAAPGGYFNLSASNAAGVTAATLTVNNDLRIVSGTLNGSSATLTVARDFINDGTFGGGTSTASFTGAPSTVRGASLTTFNNLTIAAGSLQVSTTTTPANSLRLAATWTNNGTFTAGSSTVTFTGAASSVAGTATTRFNHLTVATGATLGVSSTGNTVEINGTFSNSGAFTPGGTTVRFTGAGGALAGTSATPVSFLDVTGKLTLDATDDLTVQGNGTTGVTVPAGGTLDMQGTATLRLGTTGPLLGVVNVQGSFLASGTGPTITDAGGGTPNRYSFTVQSGGVITTSKLNVNRPDGSGINVLASAGTAIDVDGVNFTNGTGTGVYLRVMYAAIAAGAYTFSSCSFDVSGNSNVQCAAGISLNAIRMIGFGGAGSGDSFDLDPQDTDPPIDDDDGSIRWPAVKWTNADFAVNSLWSNPLNWDVGAVPGSLDRVLIDPANIVAGGTSPTLNITTTIASLSVAASATAAADGFVVADGGARNLTIAGSITVAPDGADADAIPCVVDFGSTGTLKVQGVTDLDGRIENTNGALAPLPSLDLNTLDVGGTLDLTNFKSDGIVVNGNLTNAGALTMGNETLRLKGNWSNAGAFAPGAGTVSFAGAGNQDITTADTFFHFDVNNTGGAGVRVQAQAAMIVNGNVTLTAGDFEIFGGVGLQVRGNWTNAATFTPGTSTVTFNGTANATINGGGTGAGKRFGLLTIAKSDPVTNVVSLTGTALGTSGDFSITDGVFSPGALGATVGGNWSDASVADGGMSPGTSTVTMDGAGKTITGLNSTDFNALVVSGSITLATPIAIGGLTSVTGTLDIGGITQVNSNGITVDPTGTLVMTGTSTLQTVSGQNVTINGTFRAAAAGVNRPLVTRSGVVGSWTFILNGGLDVRALDVRFIDTNGVQLSSGVTQAGVVAFENVNFGSAQGAFHLQLVHAGPLTIEAPDCVFDATFVTANVRAEDTNAVDDVAIVLEDRGTNGPGAGEALDLDVSGGEATWVGTVNNSLGGAGSSVQGFPATAYDLATGVQIGVYVTVRNAVGTTDRIYILGADGELDPSYATPYLEIPQAPYGDVVGPVWWETEGSVQTFYFGTTGGYVFRAVNDIVAFTLAIDWIFSDPPNLAEVTSPCVTDDVNVYVGGRGPGAAEWRCFAVQIKAATTNELVDSGDNGGDITVDNPPFDPTVDPPASFVSVTIDGDNFTYTGTTATSFTGVAGVTGSHPSPAKAVFLVWTSVVLPNRMGTEPSTTVKNGFNPGAPAGTSLYAATDYDSALGVGHVYRFSAADGSILDNNTTSKQHGFIGGASVAAAGALNNRVTIGDLGGRLHMMSQTGLTDDFSKNPTGHAVPPAGGSGAMSVRAMPFVDVTTGRVYHGDGDGHLYVTTNAGVDYDPGAGAYPIQFADSAALNGAPQIFGGVIVIASDNGRFFYVDESTKTAFRTIWVGAGVKLSHIGFDLDGLQWTAAGSNGRVYYFPDLPDPTP